MPNLVESLQDIEEDRWAISACFHVVVYLFYNSLNLFCYCVYFGSRTDRGSSFSIIMLILESRSLNSFDRTESKLIGLYDSVNFAGLPGFWMILICATFHRNGKKPPLITTLHNWVMYFIAISGSICSILLIMRS